jgi:putative transposase
MRRYVYSEINLHITWHTKHNVPVLSDLIADRLYRYMHRRIVTAGAIVHAIGGIEDHIHAAVTIPPTLPISEWVGDLKGASAHYINREIANRKLLAWQNGYGVVTFGTRDLEWVIQYVRNQKEHHARGTTRARLERILSEVGPGNKPA